MDTGLKMARLMKHKREENPMGSNPYYGQEGHGPSN
jgi:hypothetical protein